MKKGNLNYHYIKEYNPPKIYSDIRLLQIGTAFLQPNTTVALHTHVDFFELTVVSSGKGRITTNNSIIPVETGDIYVSFPFDQHRIDSDEENPMNYNFIAFFIDSETFSEDVEEIVSLYGHPAERIIRDETVAALLSSAISETKKEGIHSESYISSLLTQIAIQIIRHFKKQSNETSLPGKREELCFQVMDYINSHIYSIGALGDLAKHFSYDYSYLSKIFTQTTSQSISDYYRFQRLEVARDLIHKNSLKLTQIAEKLNYSSIYSFSKAFKKQYSLSPREYKKAYFSKQ